MYQFLNDIKKTVTHVNSLFLFFLNFQHSFIVREGRLFETANNNNNSCNDNLCSMYLPCFFLSFLFCFYKGLVYNNMNTSSTLTTIKNDSAATIFSFDFFWHLSTLFLGYIVDLVYMAELVFGARCSCINKKTKAQN